MNQMFSSTVANQREEERSEVDLLKELTTHDRIKAATVDGRFSPISFFFKTRNKMPGHWLLARQTFCDPVSSAGCERIFKDGGQHLSPCLLYTSPSPRDS